MLSRGVRSQPYARGATRTTTGFSLIEVMIAVVLGLIVVGSVLALVVSVLRSNAETIRSTRLTQELRALVEIVGREAERARFMADPVDNVGNPTAANNPNGLVDDATAGCLRFSYYETDLNRDGVANDPGNVAVVIARRGNALFAGRVSPAAVTAGPPAQTQLPGCDAADVQLSSPEVALTTFNIQVLDDADADADSFTDCDQADSILAVELTGSLAADADFTRTVNDRIRIGSTDLKTHCL